MYLNDFINKPLEQRELDSIICLANKAENLSNEAFSESQKSEKFLWGIGLFGLAFIELIVRDDKSVLASIFNVEFATGFGFFTLIYLIYSWREIRKSSISKYKEYDAITAKSQELFGFKLFGKTVVISDDEYSYFFDIPSFKYNFKSRNRKN